MKLLKIFILILCAVSYCFGAEQLQILNQSSSNAVPSLLELCLDVLIQKLSEKDIENLCKNHQTKLPKTKYFDLNPLIEKLLLEPSVKKICRNDEYFWPSRPEYYYSKLGRDKPVYDRNTGNWGCFSNHVHYYPTYGPVIKLLEIESAIIKNNPLPCDRLKPTNKICGKQQLFKYFYAWTQSPPLSDKENSELEKQKLSTTNWGYLSDPDKFKEKTYNFSLIFPRYKDFKKESDKNPKYIALLDMQAQKKLQKLIALYEKDVIIKAIFEDAIKNKNCVAVCYFLLTDDFLEFFDQKMFRLAYKYGHGSLIEQRLSLPDGTELIKKIGLETLLQYYMFPPLFLHKHKLSDLLKQSKLQTYGKPRKNKHGYTSLLAMKNRGGLSKKKIIKYTSEANAILYQIALTKLTNDTNTLLISKLLYRLEQLIQTTFKKNESLLPEEIRLLNAQSGTKTVPPPKTLTEDTSGVDNTEKIDLPMNTMKLSSPLLFLFKILIRKLVFCGICFASTLATCLIFQCPLSRELPTLKNRSL